MIYKSREIYFLFLCLFFSIFNDWLRIPTTPISLYRIVLPAAILLCLVRLKEIGKYILAWSVFIAVNLAQNMYFSTISGIFIPFRVTVKYFLLYLSVFAIFLMVKYIRKTDKFAFEKLLFCFLPVFGIFNLVFYWLCQTPISSWLHLANRNNYAVSLASIFPYYFLKGMEGNKAYFLPCIAIMLSLAYLGSRAAFFGIVLEIILILAMKIMKRFYGNRKRAGVLSLVAVFFVMIIFLQSPITIKNESIANTSYGLVSHVVSGELYPVSRESLHYRTNAIICMMNIIKESKGLGIGIGNTGVYLADSMPNADYYLQQQSGNNEPKILSPHFALLEFISDCGIWAIALLLVILKSALEKFMSASKSDFVDVYFVSFVLSFPIWCMSASGVYTIYYLFILIACFYEWYQMKALGSDVG